MEACLRHPSIKFLGTGDALHSGGRAHQSIAIEASGHLLLIDCGQTALYIMEKYHPLGDKSHSRIEEIDAVLFTHLHGDHFSGVIALDLNWTRNYPRHHGIIYAGPPGIQTSFELLYNLIYPGLYLKAQNIQRKFIEYQADAQDVCSQKNYDIFEDESFLISIFPMDHGCMTCYGYKIKIQLDTGETRTIAISGDTQWNKNLLPLCQDSDLAILECKGLDSAPDDHLSWKQIQARLFDIQTKQLCLVHRGKELLETIPSPIPSNIWQMNDLDMVDLITMQRTNCQQS